jgi:hypothetical protein
VYAYARGERSSRGIERRCVEDVAFRVIAAQQKPDHATIARFRVRHEEQLADLFSDVLGLCRQAGLARVGVVAIDGTKIHANASHHSNVDYQQLARQILKEAGDLDAAEDRLYGDARGDELPEGLRTVEGRRAALKEAKQRLRDRAADTDTNRVDDPEAVVAKIELDAVAIVARQGGSQGWLREGRQQLERLRVLEAWPVPRSRPERLLEAELRMQEDLAVERHANGERQSFCVGGVGEG